MGERRYVRGRMALFAASTQRFAIAALVTVVAVGAALAQSLSETPESTPTAGPGATHAVGYYDPMLRRVVLVGGASDPKAADRDHVWSWTGARWETMTDAGPPARGNAGAAYDARRRLAIVTGGARQSASDGTVEVIGETWAGTSIRWQRLAGTDLEPRDHHAMVYDEGRQSVLMFGGISGNRSPPWPSDTWELRPTGWARVATDGPAARGRTALAYDTRRRQVVLFGGVGAPQGPEQTQTFFNDTWVWQGNRWRKVAADGPRARYAHGMVFDQRAGVVLLYSGAAAHRDAPLGDMWQFDGERWTEIHLSGPTPGYRYQPVMVYDRARAKTVLYGGIQGSKDDTWEWDGRQWRQIDPAGS